MLLNNKRWVFPEVHPQYTIGLVTIRKGKDYVGTLRLRGPYPSRAHYDTGLGEDPAEVSKEEFLSWTETASVPLLPSTEAFEVFIKLREHPRLDEDIGNWRAVPTAELNATTGKKHMIVQEDPPEGAWPVYKGASLDLWNADTGIYYAWADPEYVTGVLQARRLRQQRTANSPFSSLSLEWAEDSARLPSLHPRIAFRDISRATDSRTVRAALLPGRLILNDSAPYFLWPRGDATDEAYLLGVLASIPLDWYARRFVETHVNLYIINAFPIPRPERNDPLRQEVVEISGRLAAVDDRFSEWAAEVEVSVGSVPENDKDSLTARLDAAIALLYGLNEDDLRVIYSTFHEGWNYEPRLTAVLEHFRELAGSHVQVSR